MDLFDAHSHLADPRLDQVREELMVAAQAHGVTRYLQGGIHPGDWARQMSLAERYPGRILPVFGVHPWWIADELGAGREAAVEKALSELPGWLSKAAAVGEIGIDAGPKAPRESRALQESAFCRQLGLAQEAGLPVVLHVVRAHGRVLALLKRIGPSQGGGIVHGFSGSLEVAREYLRLGLLISVGPGLVGKGFESLKRTVLGLDPHEMVIESDTPDHGSQSPEAVWVVAKALGKLKGLEARSLLERSTRNLDAIFGNFGGKS